MHLRRAVLLTLGVAVLASSQSALAGEPAIKSVLAIVQGPALLDTFKRPQGLVTDPARGIIIIADTGNHRIATFDSTFRSRGVVLLDPAHGKDPSEPRSLAIGERMRLFLVDNLNREIEVLTPRGTHLAYAPSLLPEGVGDAARPQDIVIGPSGRIYLLCGGERPGFVVGESDGSPITHVGFEPTAAGLFTGPTALDVDPTETMVAVADPMAEKPVLLFSVEGALITSFGRHGEGDGTFSMVSDVTWGPGATLWVTDTVRHSISVFDTQGTYLGRIGGFGHGPGQFDYPSGCAFLAPDRLVVLERVGARFQVLEVQVPASDHPAGATLEQGGSGVTGASLATLQGRYRW
jgi:DNA-binding beta-propeller fold protein YncE